MNAPTKTNEKGFTIIEVVLVLAIAALIFLMVFIALPALQRGQRDTQRRDDLARFKSQVNSYQTNNRGSIPSTDKVGDFVKSYLKGGSGGEFNDPSTGDPYTTTNNEASTSTSKIFYRAGYKCKGEGVESGAGNRSFAVRIQLEGSGYFCTDNQ